MIVDPAEAKRTLRALLRRSGRRGDEAGLVRRIGALRLPDGATIAGVWPLPGEPDLTGCWAELHDLGHAMVLPETTEPGQRLRFRSWSPGSVLVEGRFGTRHPEGVEREPDLLFVPLLAWDLSRHRLGYGGGYYDRTLAALPKAVAVGFGFESQRVDAIPVGPYDVALHAIVTEDRLLTAEGLSF